VLKEAIRTRLVPIATFAAAALCAMAVIAAPPASAFSKAIWGNVTYDGVNQFPLYKQLGVTIYETNLYWYEIAPTRPSNPTNPRDPAYHWPAEVQQAIADAAHYHMRVLLQIIFAPSWANGGNAGGGWAPQQASSFVEFAQAAAKKYPTVHLWMVWGEPTKQGNFMPLQSAAPGQQLNREQRSMDRLYAEMLDGTYGALKKLNKSNLIIGGCTYTTGEIDPLQWIQNMRLPNGKPPRMSMYAHNPFSYQSPQFGQPPSPFDEVQFSDLHELARWVDHYLHKGLPMFLSEWTIPTAQDDTFNFWVQPNVAAQWVSLALQEARAWPRIYGLGWAYVYDDLPEVAGGLLYQNGTPKPDFYSFENG
jgi:hypothetical protein